MKNKKIDINQRIPLDTLSVALESYLDGSYSSEYILEQLKLEFEGENRLKKGLYIVNKIIVNNPLSEYLLSNKKEIKNAIKKKADRNVILISLLNCAFPFSFDVLRIFGKYFSVQEIISSETVKKDISKVYGGNRSPDNGFYCVTPMFIEAAFFYRPKSGVYQWKENLNVITSIAREIYLESFKLNNNIIDLQDYQKLDPYFLFIGN